MKNPAFLVADLETTDREPANAHVIEWAIVLYTPPAPLLDQGTSRQPIEPLGNFLVKPPVPIPPETSAIHHITDDDVAGASDWAFESNRIREVIETFKEQCDPVVLVAHNTSVEQHFLASLAPGVPWICTYKCALRTWPESPAHSNEALRYFLKLPNIGRRCRQNPHSALHDATVTAHLLGSLLRHMELLNSPPLETLLQWSSEGALLPRCPIGKYRNWPWAEVDDGYLDWIVYKATDMREDVLHSAKVEIERRRQEMFDLYAVC